MPSTLTPAEIELEERKKAETADGGGDTHGGTPGPGGNGDGGNGDPDPGDEAEVQTYKLGMWIGIAGVVMIFGAFTSAMVVRKGIGGDWESFELPVVLWISTALLLASSFTIHRARRFLLAGLDGGLRRWMSATAALGAVFLICQLLGWRELASRGLYLATNPSSSFFYILTGTHGIHLLGGMVALGYVLWRLWSRRKWPTRRAAIEAMAIYWHFLDGLWLYILALLWAVG